MANPWIEIVVSVLGSVLVALLAYLSKAAGMWIRAHVSNVQLSGVLLRLNDTVGTVVADIAQREVEAMKRAAIDGKLSAEEIASLRDVAWIRVKAHMGDGWSTAEQVLGLTREQLTDLVLAKVEAEVLSRSRSR